MCLITLAYETHPKYRLVLASNRDEVYRRPTATAHFWEDHPEVLAGRDLEKMGTWMGITKTGRFAAITNFRDPASEKKNAQSRGELVSGFLCGDDHPDEYAEAVRRNGDRYNGFNLIVGDQNAIFYYSNRGSGVQQLNHGVYGLSNGLLDSPWPKVEKSKERLKRCLKPNTVDPGCLFDLLEDEEKAEDDALPDTGVSLELERLLSPPFIKSPDYGTRASTVLLIDHDGQVIFKERSFYPEHKESEHRFQIST